MNKKIIIFPVLLLVLCTFVATDSVYSGWVKEKTEFIADGINFSVESSPSYTDLILRTNKGVIGISYERCEMFGKYEICFLDYKFSLGNKTKISGRDTEEYQITIDSTYKDAKLSFERNAVITQLYVGDKTRIETRVKNEGEETATDIIYFELFPQEAKIEATLYTIKNNKIEWTGALSPNSEKDIFYDISFEKSGNYTIPMKLSYFDGITYQDEHHEIKFEVKDQYHGNLSPYIKVEVNEPSKVNLYLYGQPKKILAVRATFPLNFKITNTTNFKKEVEKVYWVGNLTSEKNLTVDFYATKEGSYDVDFYVYYKSSNIYNKYPVKINVTRKKLSVNALFIKKDRKTEIRVIGKNDNKYVNFKDINLIVSSDIYSANKLISKLNAKQNEYLLTDVFQINDNYLHKLRVITSYYVDGEQIKQTRTYNLSQKIINELPKPANLTPAEVVETKKEPMWNESEQQEEKAKVKKRNVIQKFFDWLSALLS